MTPILLIDELVAFIETAVKDFELPSNVKGVKKAPQVVSGYLSEKKPTHRQEIPDFPYVIVRFLEDDDTDQSNVASVRIIAGTYSEDDQNGWRDCMNVITRIKGALLKHRFIGGAFRVEKPIRTELPEEQMYPAFVALMTLHVTMPQVQEEGDYFKNVFK